MKKFKTVFKFTYLWNIKSKAFIITTIIGVLLVALLTNFNTIMDKIVGNSVKEIALCDYDNNFSLTEEELEFQDCNFYKVEKSDIEDIKKDIEDGKGDKDYLITMYSKDKENIEVYSKSNSNSDTMVNITNYLKTKFILRRAVNSNLEPEVLNSLMADVTMEFINTDEAKTGNMVMVYFLILTLFMMIIFYGMDVLNSVVEEKNNRIMETLITMAKPLELCLGKVLGVCAVTFTQLAILSVSGFIFVGLNKDVVSFFNSLNINLDFKLVFSFSAFIILGYLLYAFIFAALGSLVSSTQDSSQAVLPLTFLLLIIMMSGIMALTNIEATFVTVCSYIPFSSPVFMFERIVLTDVSSIEIIVSLMILLISIIVVGILSSKVYKKGTLHYGKRASYFKVLLDKK